MYFEITQNANPNKIPPAGLLIAYMIVRKFPKNTGLWPTKVGKSPKINARN
jgi:hypothetical protein